MQAGGDYNASVLSSSSSSSEMRQLLSNASPLFLTHPQAHHPLLHLHLQQQHDPNWHSHLHHVQLPLQRHSLPPASIPQLGAHQGMHSPAPPHLQNASAPSAPPMLASLAEERGNASRPLKRSGKKPREERLKGDESGSGLTLSCESLGHGGGEDGSSRKRRRGSWSSTKALVQRLAKQLLEQQRDLHSRFLETIEQRDRESMVREEALRKQEVDRVRMEQELRSQDLAIAASRDAALLDFLQKLTSSQPNMAPKASEPDHQNKDLREGINITSSTRWPKVEIYALIRLRSAMEARFQEAGPKIQLWKEISSSMACMGYNRSAKRCKEKWENINKYFRKMKDSSTERPHNAKTCPYFHHLDNLYQSGVLGSPNYGKWNKLEDKEVVNHAFTSAMANPVVHRFSSYEQSSTPDTLQKENLHAQASLRSDNPSKFEGLLKMEDENNAVIMALLHKFST